MESLSIKYRPRTFDDVVGQSGVVDVLSRQVQQEVVRNAYLLSGPSGCGKTTLARILAKALNGESYTPIEIDAASNSGVENVRGIIKDANERSLSGEYKVYILDEVHALSNTAWQAFLKCLEEPPYYTIFIFCTTDPQKIPDTIINRVQVFNLNRIKVVDIEKRLKYICDREHFTNYEETISYIARKASGSLRQAISLLDKCASCTTDLVFDKVAAAIGECSFETCFTLTDAIIDGDIPAVLRKLEDINSSGVDFERFIESYVEFILDILKFYLLKDWDCVNIPSRLEDKVAGITNFDGVENYYQYILTNLYTLRGALKNSVSVKSDVEIVLMKLARCA